MNNQKAFEAELFAKQHYRKLLTAKSSLAKTMHPNPPPNPIRTISPLDRYEHQTANSKICHKLREIYKCPETTFRKYRRSSDKKTKPSRNHSTREENRSITQDNLGIFERILCAKSTISEDWKARERQLKRYGKLARKKTAQTDECLFNAYQQLLMQSRMNSGRKRPQSSRPRRQSSAKSKRSEIKLQDTA